MTPDRNTDGFRAGIMAAKAQLPQGFQAVRTPWSQSSSGAFTGTMERALTADETDSGLCFNRSTMRFGETPPLHIHINEDEFWIILRGSMRYWFGAADPLECDIQDAPQGSVIALPRSIPHSFTPLTQHVEFLSAFCPGHLQNAFSEIGSTKVRDDTAHTEVFTRYGVHFVGPIPQLTDTKPVAEPPNSLGPLEGLRRYMS